MKKKKISYLTLFSDLYILLCFSYLIYAYFYGFERVGRASFSIINISDNIALTIGILETVLCLVFAFLLHKCNFKKNRYILMILCMINIVYRLINVISIISIFNMFMIILNLFLFTILRFYK